MTDDHTWDVPEDDPIWQELVAAGQVTPVRAEEIERVRTSIRAVSATERSAARPVRKLGRPARRRRRMMVGVACAVAVAVALIALPTVPWSGRQPVATATASDFLRHAATQVPLSPAPDTDYYRVEYESMSTLPQGGKDLRSTRIVLWYGRAGDTHMSRNGSAPKRLSEGVDVAQFVLGSGTSLTWAEVAALPVDPEAIEPLLQRSGPDGRADPPATRFDALCGLLATAPLSGAQRRAILTVLADIPGSELLGDTHDRLERDGTAIEIRSASVGVRLVVTDSGEPLETSITTPSGSVMEDTVFVSARGVQSVRADS